MDHTPLVCWRWEYPLAVCGQKPEAAVGHSQVFGIKRIAVWAQSVPVLIVALLSIALCSCRSSYPGNEGRVSPSRMARLSTAELAGLLPGPTKEVIWDQDLGYYRQPPEVLEFGRRVATGEDIPDDAWITSLARSQAISVEVIDSKDYSLRIGVRSPAWLRGGTVSVALDHQGRTWVQSTCGKVAACIFSTRGSANYEIGHMQVDPSAVAEELLVEIYAHTGGVMMSDEWGRLLLIADDGQASTCGPLLWAGRVRLGDIEQDDGYRPARPLDRSSPAH